jgi:subtilisin family serine protease
MVKSKSKSATHEPEPVYGLPPVFVHELAIALPLAGEVNWGMEVFAVNQLRRITDGKGIKLGVVDTGIDLAHPLLQNCAGFKSFAGGEWDRNGHGTHCSGTVFGTDPRIGVAPGATGYHGKGLGDSGSGGNGLISAIEWCVEQGCTVVSNSWGGGGQSQAWEQVFRRLADAGIWLVFAGGNSGPNTPNSDWPGRSENLINVAALNSNLTPASFSSAGDKLDTSGPGVDIWSCKSGGGFARMSGTSMATPFVAGLLGLYRRALELKGLPIPKVHELRAQLFKSSTDIHTPGDDRRTGPGWLAPALLALGLEPLPPPVGATHVRDRIPARGTH